MKTCTRCGETKARDLFGRDARKPDGLRYDCKACVNERMSAWRQANAAKVAEQKRLYYEANAAKVAEQQRAYREANAAKVAERKRAYREANAAKIAERMRAWQQANAARIAEQGRLYREANPHLVNAKTARRRAAQLQRTVAWSDAVAIATLYEIAARVSRCTGIEHHVDHVVPLQGRKVSGLHVPLNLRVVPATLNLRKNNRFEVRA